jgi:hypothetical protein
LLARRLSATRREALFRRLAAAALGHARALAGMPAGREAAAALPMRRGCMDHLALRTRTGRIDCICTAVTVVQREP